MKRIIIVALAPLLALGLLACQPATKDDIQALKEQQAEILLKLTALDESLKKVAAAAPARRGPPAEDFNKVHQIDVSTAAVLGNPNAPITVVEFSDFECPYCARSAPEVKALQAKYPDKVRVVYKHFPLGFHKSARPAAIASVAAQEQDKFWEYHDVLFEATTNRQLSGSQDDLVKYAEKAGLDVPRFKKDMAAKQAEYDKRVNEDYAAGQKASVRGTPTLFINGKKVQDRTVQGMSNTVDQMLAEMEKKS